MFADGKADGKAQQHALTQSWMHPELLKCASGT